MIASDKFAVYALKMPGNGFHASSSQWLKSLLSKSCSCKISPRYSVSKARLISGSISGLVTSFFRSASRSRNHVRSVSMRRPIVEIVVRKGLSLMRWLMILNLGIPDDANLTLISGTKEVSTPKKAYTSCTIERGLAFKSSNR